MKYENIIFLQGDSSEEALEIYNNEGAKAAIEFLSQWHFPGEHETRREPSAGNADTTIEIDNYILTVNTSHDYIGLEARI